MASARQAVERQAIERQYAAQAHALATDPLVRLQVNKSLNYHFLTYVFGEVGIDKKAHFTNKSHFRWPV